MVESADPDLAVRVRAIREQVEAAHACLKAGDAAGCGWRARTATESMLIVLCEVHDVPIPTSSKDGTLVTLRKALRHANQLDRKLEDHVNHVQNLGNRAAHAQRHTSLAIDLGEARSLLPALDHIHAAFLARLPDELIAGSPTAPPRTWSVLVTSAALMAAMPVITFVMVFAALSQLTPPGTPLPAPAPRLGDATLPPLPEVDPGEVPASAQPGPVEFAVAAVRADQPLTMELVDGLDCGELEWSRNWLWARHGYVFASEGAQQRFAATEGYVRLPDAGSRDIERRFTDVERRNLELLNEELLRLDCRCPRRWSRKVPCPD